MRAHELVQPTQSTGPRFSAKCGSRHQASRPDRLDGEVAECSQQQALLAQIAAKKRAELPFGATERGVDARLCRALFGAKRVSPPSPCVLATVERALAVSGQFRLATNKPAI